MKKSKKSNEKEKKARKRGKYSLFKKFLLLRSLRYREQQKGKKLKCLVKIHAKSREMMKTKLIMKTKIAPVHS